MSTVQFFSFARFKMVFPATATAADHNAGRAALNRANLRLIAVRDQNDIVLVHELFNDLGTCADVDMPLLDARLRVAGNHLRVEGRDKVLIGRLCGREYAVVEEIHVDVCDIGDRNQTQEFLLPRS